MGGKVLNKRSRWKHKRDIVSPGAWLLSNSRASASPVYADHPGIQPAIEASFCANQRYMHTQVVMESTATVVSAWCGAS